MNNTNQINQINPSCPSRLSHAAILPGILPDVRTIEFLAVPKWFSSNPLVGASIFKGEFRDGGLVQLAFAKCDQSEVLIVGRLS